MAFELGKGGPADLDAMMTVLTASFRDDGMWKHMMANVTPEDEHAAMVEYFSKYFKLNRSFYKITEIRTGKIVAFTALEFPHNPTAEERALVEDEGNPIKGINEELERAFLHHTLQSASRYGYDVEKDFQRRGTMVHPDYQRQGHGTRLIRHCNEIADKAGRRTYVVVRPASKHMFETLGFKEIGVEDVDLSNVGGTPEEGRNWVLVREPQGS